MFARSDRHYNMLGAISIVEHGYGNTGLGIRVAPDKLDKTYVGYGIAGQHEGQTFKVSGVTEVMEVSSLESESAG